MPYTEKKSGSGVDIYKEGKKVAHAKSKKNAGIFEWKASAADRAPRSHRVNQ